MVWSHNDHWMMTGDHAGFVKYWQSNMNNVKMYQAHKDPIRGLRCVIVGKELVSLGQLLVYNFNAVMNKIICSWWSMLSNSFHLLVVNLLNYIWHSFLNHICFHLYFHNYFNFLLGKYNDFVLKIMQIITTFAQTLTCIALDLTYAIILYSKFSVT